MNRRKFLKTSALGVAGLALSKPIENPLIQKGIPKIVQAKEFTELASPEYKNISHDEIQWEEISKGLDFSRTNVYKQGKLIDIIAGVKINPNLNKIKVYNTATETKDGPIYTIEEWQEKTGSLAILNAAQYQFLPWGLPQARIISNGKIKGSKNNRVKGMLVSEPKQDLQGKIKNADLLDFNYDKFDIQNPQYTEGVEHWPILLNRKEEVKVKPSLWQANRTITTKTHNHEIIFLTTEGGFFTLYNIGQFLRDSNKRKDKGFNTHTAMNLDGGYEACMAVKTPKLQYYTYGEFETQGPNKDISVFNRKMPLAGTIGISKRI